MTGGGVLLAAPTALRTIGRGIGRRAGLALALVVLTAAAIAVIAPGMIAPTDPLAADPSAALRPPGPDALAGTDQLGRDVATRVVHGARASLLAGLFATAIGLGAGIPLGLVTGLARGSVDEVGLRTIDLLSAFPGILLALVVIAIAGPGPVGLVVALGVALVPTFARLVRSETRRVHRSAYVEHARMAGVGWPRIAARHLVPNVSRALPGIVAITFAGAVLGAAALSFIGLGAGPPSPEWGAMLADGRNHLGSAWWISVFPGLALALVAIAMNTVGRRVQAGKERTG